MEAGPEDRAVAVGRALQSRRLRMAVAESCTGGAIAARCTAVPGSSDWFDCGVVAYTLDAKTRLLGVDPALLASPGPVSEPVAREMALGLLRRCRADVTASVTGVAGPGGGMPSAPVGTVWLAWARRAADGEPELIQSARHMFGGSRTEVCAQAVETALDGILRALV